ncbi:MAG: GNAT family N-acetyltransferase [Proteobacteria bacterium]|nr:GNAT family N-acetyltransferase [Pseudomonadota bacterium]
MEIVQAESSKEIETARILFREYQSFLVLDLDFQNFEQELAGLPGKYSRPKGAILLAVEEKDVAGCVAVRELENGICEMKRLFVRSPYRGRGLGRSLALAVIQEATELGYSLMRLDTLNRLHQAMRLYESLGFREIEAYYDNPLPGVVYWELELKT